MAAYIFKLQVTNLSFDRRTFCTSLSSVEIHFQLNRYFTTFIVFSTSRLFIYLCTTFIKRIIHNLICSDALCMRNNVQGTFYIMFCKFMQFNKIFKTIFEYIRKKFRFVHTNTFCEHRKKIRASPRVHLVNDQCVIRSASVPHHCPMTEPFCLLGSCHTCTEVVQVVSKLCPSAQHSQCCT